MTPLNRGLLALSFSAIAAYGALFYAFALIAPPMAEELGWSRSAVFAGFSLTLLVSGVLAPFVGRIIDRDGGRFVLTCGALLAAISLAGFGLARDGAQFLAACVACGAAMAMSFYDAIFGTIARLSPKGARRAITLLTLAAGFASTIFWPLTHWLIEAQGWRFACFAFAALHGLISAPLLFFALRPAPQAEPEQNPAPESDSRDVTGPPTALASRGLAFSLLAVTTMAHGMVGNGVLLHLPPALAALGADPGHAILVGAVIGPAQVLSRFLDLSFGRRLSPMHLGLIAYGLPPAALLVLLLLPVGPASLLLFAAMYGFGAGLTTIARGVVPLKLFGPDGYGAMLGLIAAPAFIAMAAAPAGLALIWAHFGVAAMLWTGAGAAMTGFVSMAALAIRFPART